MKTNYTVPLTKIIKEFSLEKLYVPANLQERVIASNEVNRPGLQIAGYFEFFDEKRIQIIGKAEESFLANFIPEKAKKRVEDLFSHKPSAVVVCRNLDIPETFIEFAEKYDVPLFRTSVSTSSFSSALIAFLNVNLAPRITRHGVLVEVYGEGVLLYGDSGVGKSEVAMELIKRGHRLIADDAVEIRRVSNRSLVGTSPENIRHFMELRGVGIINARNLFGMGAVKLTEKIDMVINMEQWDTEKVYDRIGMDNTYTEIMGIQVPIMTIPVKPGRNLAIIIEAAAMNNRQKKMGYNAAQELYTRVQNSLARRREEDEE